MRFASLLVYTPRGRDHENRGTGPQEIMDAVKAARPDVLARIAVRCGEVRDAHFADFFTPASTLVPVPTSAPAKARDTLWPGLSIAEALSRHGLGRDVQALLVRTSRVTKAHRAEPADRPRFGELVASLEWRGNLGSNLERIILVDDVVTRGTTFLAAREAIQRVQPWLDVEGFAAIRTMSFELVTKPVWPVMGKIQLQTNGWGDRDP